MDDGKGSLPDATRLALDRTRLAYERTLMAWVRTSASLISFGFTFYKFFQAFGEIQQRSESAAVVSTRGVALLLISTGIVGLALATIEHRRNLGVLRAQYGSVPVSMAAIMASFVSVLGCLGVLAVYFRQ
jgi:putative membrane protein